MIRFDRDCIVLDYETTDKNPNIAEVLQVSIIDGWGFPLLNTYCKPEYAKQWPEAQAVNGITPETVKDKPTFRELAPAVQKIIDRAPFVLAYNARYELSVSAKYGITFRKPLIDPMLMFASVYGEWNYYYNSYRWQKLTTAARYYNYDFAAHDALADVQATLHIFESMVKEGVAPVAVC